MRAPVPTHPTRGILDPATAAERFELARFVPEGALQRFVTYYWTIRWDLRGTPPHVQQVLPYPDVHLVIDRARSGVFGVVTQRFERRLRGAGRVLGVRFRPGAFHAFSRRPICELTDRVLPLDAVFPIVPGREIDRVLSCGDPRAQIDRVESWLGAALPEVDPRAARVEAILSQIERDRRVHRAAQVAERAGCGLRTLQRLFRRYVGVGPKWVIRRYRLQEAAERLARGEAPDRAALALALGYADQAHLTRDFTALVGQPPARYAARCRAPGDPPGDPASPPGR